MHNVDTTVIDRDTITTASGNGDRLGMERTACGWSKVAVILSIPLLACVCSFFLVYSQFFRHRADPLWVQASSQVFSARNEPCEVVIYGDSTAITGIDPKIIEASTHLTTCNIAQTKSLLVVLGTSALDLYLRNNPRPKVLLLQFSGADFYTPKKWSDTTAYMEGVVSLLRYYPLQQTLAATLHHPDIFIGMMHYAYVTGVLSFWRNMHEVSSSHDGTSPVDVHLVRPTPPYDSCGQVVEVDPMFHAPDPAFIHSLREQFSSLTDHLLIDVAPTSTCDMRYQYVSQRLRGTDNPLEQFPVQLFNEGFTHYTAMGAERRSWEVSTQIKNLMLDDRTDLAYASSTIRRQHAAQ